MTSPDSDSGFHPENPEPNQTPQRIELNQTMSPEGSVGFNLFPAILAGRKRPETTFNQPLLGSIWETNNAKALQELQGQGLVTVVDVLRLSETQLLAFGRTDEIKKRLGRHLETLAVTPHARLLGAVFGESQSPVPPEREAELTEAVEKQLETLIPREHQVLTLRFGLRDGITRTLEKVGRELTVTRERARQIEDKALRKLRQEVQGEKLRPYLTLPEDSFGREVFGAVLRQDLLQLDTSRRLDVSSETLEGLMPYQWFIDLRTGRSPADKFLTADLSGLPLSPQARKEIGEALRSLVVDERSQQETPSPQEPPAEISAEPPVNRLLAELFIPEDKLRALAQQTIESLELQTQAYHALKRAGVTTIGDLLKIPKGELLELRNLGKKGISELAEKLQELLELPTPDYPPGFIHSLLTAKDRKPPRKQKV